MKNTVHSLWNFARPHTILGTSLAVISLYLIARFDTHNPGNFTLFLATFLASLSINIYVVGLNQLTDVDIDKINKPYLPLVSQKLSLNQARWIVTLAAFTALGLAYTQNAYLFLTILTVFLVGTAYSLPPIRLKRFSLFASLCIILTRGVIANAGIYLSYTNEKPQLPTHVLIFIILMSCFAAVIAIMKDVPDVEGDRQYSISTLVTRIGATKVLSLSKFILIFCYLFMIMIGLIGIQHLDSTFMIASHTLLLAIFLFKSNLDIISSQQKFFRYYMFIWNLFYLEFFAFFLAVAFAKNPLV